MRNSFCIRIWLHTRVRHNALLSWDSKAFCMIKIAFVIDTIASPTGGTEKQLLLLLEKLDRTKFSPILFVLYPSEWLSNNFDLCPYHVINITSYRKPVTLLRFYQFVRILKSEKIDIVHALFKEGMRIGITAAKLAAVPFIISVRRSQGYWMTGFDLKVTKFLNRWVDLVIANAHNTRVWAAETEGFPMNRIQVVHNGIDLGPFVFTTDSIRCQYRANLDIPATSPVIGIVANLRPVKAIDHFIRAAKLVTASIPDAHFVIVGEGGLDAELKQLAKDLGIADCVHFLGSRHDIPPIMAMFDIGVLASESESFSNTIVEYLASGLPVVCTDVGGAREAVEDGVNGFVVPVGDYSLMSEKIVSIVRSGKAIDMGKLSRQKAEMLFSCMTMIHKYENIYVGAKEKP